MHKLQVPLHATETIHYQTYLPRRNTKCTKCYRDNTLSNLFPTEGHQMHRLQVLLQRQYILNLISDRGTSKLMHTFQFCHKHNTPILNSLISGCVECTKLPRRQNIVSFISCWQRWVISLHPITGPSGWVGWGGGGGGGGGWIEREQQFEHILI